MTITPVYRVQCSGPCRRWLSLPDGYQPGEDLPLAALVPQATAERAGMWPDETAARYAAFGAGWSSGTCPDCAAGVQQDAPRREPHPTEADMHHAQAVLNRFHGRDTDEPAAEARQDVAQSTPDLCPLCEHNWHGTGRCDGGSVSTITGCRCAGAR